VPAARLDALALTEIVAGAIGPDSVTVSQGTVEVTVNGTMFPLPAVLTFTFCEETPCDPPACPLNVSEVGETVSTGFVVITSETGITVTLPPETLMVNVVV
jgi:hypothetical protein